MRCKYCGTDNKDNSVFCENCHKYIGTEGKYIVDSYNILPRFRGRLEKDIVLAKTKILNY